MEFIGNLPVFFWVAVVFFAIGGIYRLVVGQSTQRDMEQAESMAHSDRWEESAAIYRGLILDRLDFSDKAIAAADKLKALYREHDVDADVSALEQSMELLKDIENAKVSDRKKNGMRSDLQQNLIPVLNALPPVIETTAEGGGQEEFTPSALPEPLDASCQFCDQGISGTAWLFDDYAENPNLDPNQIVGFVCPSCDAASHRDCDSGVVYKTWSGYDKSVCKNCNQPVKEPKVVFPA